MARFAMNCGALARGVVFKDFEMQVVSEETAEHIQASYYSNTSANTLKPVHEECLCVCQCEMRRQKMLQQPSPIPVAPSAALLAMKPTSGTKRANAQAQQ